MKKIFLILSSVLFLGGNGVFAQSLKKQNEQLKTQNVALTDSIRKLSFSLDSVSQLKAKLLADYESIKEKYSNSGNVADSLMKVSQLQASEIYALQLTNDSLNSRIQKLLAERDFLQYQSDSLMALQENKKKEKKQKALWDRRGWFNIAFSPQKMNSDLYRSELKSDFAVGITAGRTFYLHKKPLANMVRFALNWSYLDLNIAKYSASYNDRIDEEGDYGMGDVTVNPYYSASHPVTSMYDSMGDEYEDWNDSESEDSQYKMELGMQIGLAVIVNPIDHLMIQAYFHYSPTFSALLDEDLSYYGTYASFFNAGVSVSYKAIGLGIEGRWGTSTFSQEVYSEADEDYVFQDMKWKTKGMRVYLSFRF